MSMPMPQEQNSSADTVESIIIGSSPPVQHIRQLIRQVARGDLSVMICGESGVGKELVAQALHYSSSRKDRPFIKVNCAAIPSTLLESEFFGYQRGAFTGANSNKMGKFELAHGGTIFLDEIGEMPPNLQSKMLQVLQDFQFCRLGASEDVSVNCWVIAATNRNLERAVAEGQFRQDLYYRLNAIKINVPTLRSRPEDIDVLLDHFVKEFAGRIDRPLFRLTPEIQNFLRNYSWPGNIRELKNTIERLALLGDWKTVKRELLGRGSQREDASEEPFGACETMVVEDPVVEAAGASRFPPLKEYTKKAAQEAEGNLIREVLRQTGWNRRKGARILKISYKALLYKIKELGLPVED